MAPKPWDLGLVGGYLGEGCQTVYIPGIARTPNMKLMIVGHGRHGKDTVCELLRDKYGLTFVSSSEFVGKKAVYPHMVDKYSSFEQCYADRHNHRSFWFDKISEYNAGNPARLGTELFYEYDIYCGLRSKKEFHALKNRAAFFKSIWVDRSEHVPPEPSTSMTIEPWMADYILDNNGTVAQLKSNLHDLFTTIRTEHENRQYWGHR